MHLRGVNKFPSGKPENRKTAVPGRSGNNETLPKVGDAKWRPRQCNLGTSKSFQTSTTSTQHPKDLYLQNSILCAKYHGLICILLHKVHNYNGGLWAARNARGPPQQCLSAQDAPGQITRDRWATQEGYCYLSHGRWFDCAADEETADAELWLYMEDWAGGGACWEFGIYSFRLCSNAVTDKW